MDPITTAIIAALTLGVAGGVTEVGKSVIVEAYDTLKGILRQKLGGDSEVAAAVESLEKKPDSGGRQATLAEEVKAAQAEQDPAILAAAQALLDKLKEQPQGPQHIQQVAQGSYIAQASQGSTATVKVNQPDEE
jgi:hypothetical protein